MRDIAALIRSGCDDPAFIKLLADHIDPDCKTPFGIKFVVKRSKKGAPKRGSRNTDLEHFLWRHIDVWKEPVEAVVTHAQSVFGVGRTVCFAALQKHREWLKENPEFEDSERHMEMRLRELGHPDAEPFSPGKG